MAINTPRSTPEVDKVLQAAKEQKDIPLDENDLAVVIDNSQELADKAKVTLETKEQWQKLKDIIESEEKEVENADVVADGKDKLNVLRSEIATQMNRPAVQDLEPPLVNAQKPFLERLKDMSFVSPLVRAWVWFQKNVVGGDKAKLDALEEMAGEWFGAAELRSQMNTALKAQGIEVRKGVQDGLGYARFQGLYQQALIAEQAKKTRKDTAGKDIPLTAAELKATAAAYPFKLFLDEAMKKYVAENRGVAPAGQKRVTTIMGIANSEKPSVVAA